LHGQCRYTLPDGREIQIGRERFEASEALFSPKLVDVEGSGMADLVFETINAAPIDTRAQLYEQIVLSGQCSTGPVHARPSRGTSARTSTLPAALAWFIGCC